MQIVTWIIGGIQRMQAAYHGFVYRVAVPSDTVGPTIVGGLMGR